MYAVFRIGHFPSESDSETMLKVLKWGVVPLNLKGHGMTPHSLCWARINSPELVSHFNIRWTQAKRPDLICVRYEAPIDFFFQSF